MSIERGSAEDYVVDTKPNLVNGGLGLSVPKELQFEDVVIKVIWKPENPGLIALPSETQTLTREDRLKAASKSLHELRTMQSSMTIQEIVEDDISLLFPHSKKQD